jgi:ABC-type Fe3+/spermidine/putrescine transport system ATPase subunit
VAGDAEGGAKVSLSVRPEHLHTRAARGRLALGQGKVIDGGFFGTHHQYALGLEGFEKPVKVRLEQTRALNPGDRVALYASPADMVLLTR